MATPNCGHCSGIQNNVNELCKQNGWQVNHLVMIFDQAHPNGCFCTCSCLAFGTPIQSGDGGYKAVEKYSVGDTVLACGPALQWKSARVEFSNGTPGVAVQRYTVLVVYKDTSIAVTSDHLFLMSDGALRRADRLAPGDELVDPQGISVPIRSVHIGNMHAGFHHIATSTSDPGSSLEGHLLNTNGVVSADYAVQLYYRDPSRRAQAGKSAFSGDHDNLPIVGSAEYIARHGDKCRCAPDRATEFVSRGGETHVKVMSANLQPGSGGVFVPADATMIRVPAHAHSFISQQEAQARAVAPKRAFNDPQSRAWVEYLLEHHRHFYSDIRFTLDWASNDVNAYAWVEHDGTGQRRVDIKGGLVRDMALELEGIALVIAHEIAHHRGGAPTGGHPDGLSCEGQADYAGVGWVMRQVWFGTQFPTTVSLAISQMAAFFGVPDSPNAPGGSAGCNHPAGACRIATYYAAAALTAKPNCAS